MTASAFFDEFDRLVKSGCDHFVVRNSACCEAKVSSYKLSILSDFRGREGFVVGRYGGCGNIELKIVQERQIGMLDVSALSVENGAVIVDVKDIDG